MGGAEDTENHQHLIDRMHRSNLKSEIEMLLRFVVLVVLLLSERLTEVGHTDYRSKI